MTTVEKAETDWEEGTRQKHELKCLPAYFQAILRGDKAFEVRRDDRGFQRGDLLWLREYDPKGLTPGTRYTGNSETVEVSYVLTGGQLGIEPGYVVMGIRQLEQE